MYNQDKKTVKLPDPLAPFEEKIGEAYGLSVGKLIGSHWFGGGMINGGCDFLTRKEYVRQKRLFVRAENDTKYFKDQLFDDGKLEYANLDFTNKNWAGKFSSIAANGLNDKNYKLDIRATDKLAALKKSQKQDYYLKYMRGRPMLEKANKILGVDLMPKSFIPEDEEEMQMHMELKDRPRIEIAEEILIDYVLNTNNWSSLQNMYNKDIVDVGLICVRVYTDKQNGVSLAYVDPENYIHSRVSRNDFEDKYYEGYVDTVTISTIKRESGFDDDKCRKIAQSYSGINSFTGSYDSCPFEELLDQKINVLRYAYKTSKTISYKKKLRNGQTIKVSKKASNYEPPISEDVGKTSQTFDTWIEGSYIVGSEYVYGYKECENNYDDIMNKAMSPFVTVAYDIYENRLRSFVSNIEPHARELQKISLKIQQLCSELTPDLKEVDLDMLAELDDGKGGVKKDVWKTALNLMATKGVIFTKRVNMGEDGIKDKAAVRPSTSPQGSALTALLNVFAHEYNLIRELTGINPARDGSMNADSLVGVNQMAQMASNTVTHNLVEASVYFKKKISEVISTRIHTIFNYKEASKVREIYEAVVGKNMMDAIEVLKDRHLHEFGFTFEMNATAEEIKDFNETLSLALQDGSIDVEIVFQTKQIAKVNVKKAIDYMMFQRRKRNKQRQEEKTLEIQNQAQANAQSAQSAEQAKLQAYQAKKQIDLTFESQMSQIRVAEKEALMQIEAPQENQKFEKEVYLAKINSMTSLEKEQFKEDRKDDRTKLQASQQSKMVDQRQKNGQPIDFEKEEKWFVE
ncbi:MAG: Cellulophaga phage phi46:3 [Bacteroidota bacterium]|jgi:hypothetical protein